MSTALFKGDSDLTPVDLTSEAFDLKDSHLFDLGMVADVTSPESAAAAAMVIKTATGFVRSIEQQRKVAKEPFLQAGKRIQALATDLTESLKPELARVGKMIADYQSELNRQRAEAERLARVEAAALLAKAREEAETAKQLEEPEEVQQEIVEKAVETARHVHEAAVATVAPKIAGLVTREVIKIKITDIESLANEFPYMVAMTPDLVAIKTHLKANPKSTLPGVRHWVENKTSVRN